MTLVNCTGYIEDPNITDDVGEPKGQCFKCGSKWYEHQLSVLPAWEIVSAADYQKRHGIEGTDAEVEKLLPIPDLITMTVADEWRDFHDAVLKNASEVQRIEMRRAFYAGAHMMLCKLRCMGEVRSVGRLHTDVAHLKITALEQEIKDYKQQVIDGKA